MAYGGVSDAAEAAPKGKDPVVDEFKKVLT
jgi:hypothetical protein